MGTLKIAVKDATSQKEAQQDQSKSGGLLWDFKQWGVFEKNE